MSESIIIKLLYARIQYLETLIEENIERVHTRINVLEKKYALESTETPHVCPICDGSGKEKIRSDGLMYFCCHSCEGRRIIWG